ncbi:MAG: hypothetical protein ACM3ZT_06955 [Bacillota bacterium]
MNFRHPVWRAILWGGLVAGTVDIGSACIINLLSPVVILHAIASGLLGKPSFEGGLSTAMLGLFLQWFMGLLIATIYVTAALRLKWMHRDWRLTGVAYGVVIYFVMTYVVVPLSAFPIKRNPAAPFNWVGFAENLVAMILFGFIVAFFAKRYLPRRAA